MGRERISAAVLFLVLLLFPQNLFAQAKTPLVVITPGETITTRIIFLVDVSGSMHSPRGTEKFHPTGVDWALASMNFIAESVGDEAHCKFYAFGGGVGTYKTSWISLPDKQEMMDVITWYRGIAGMADMQSSTQLMPALRLAFSSDEKDLSIVIITDSLLDDDTQVLQDINKLNAERPTGPVPIALVCVGDTQSSDDTSKQLTHEVSGYYLRPSKLPMPEEEHAK